MDPTFYHQWSPPTRLGGRAIPQALGLFISVSDESKAVKAVPIIGESKAPKPTPALVSPKGESLAKPVVPTKDVRASAQPKILGPSGQQVHADPPKPSPFVGSVGGPKKPTGPSKIVTPGPQPKTSVSLARTPHDKPLSGPTPSIVDPAGRKVSSKITEGPGAAKPDPKLAIPAESMPKRPGTGKLETPSPSSARPGSKVTAEGAEWTAAIEAAKKREAKTAEGEARARPLDFKPKPQVPAEAPKSKDVQATETAQALMAAGTPGERKLMAAGGMKDPKATPESGPLTPQQKQMVAAAGGEGGGGPGRGEPVGGGSGEIGRDGAAPGRAGGAPGAKKPGKGPNITGWMGTGYNVAMANDPSATASILGMRAGAMAQGALSEPTRHEAARQGREAFQQRQEMIRQQHQQTQSALQASLTARDGCHGSPPIRSGLSRRA